MSLVFNIRGILLAVGSLAIGWVIAWALDYGDNEALIMILSGPILLGADGWIRKRQQRSLWRGSEGGSLFWMPAWTFGLAWILFGLVRLLGLYRLELPIHIVVASMFAYSVGVSIKSWWQERQSDKRSPSTPQSDRQG